MSDDARALLDRLSRLSLTESWEADLHPVQRAALAYLAQANRFSRAPSQVAEYLGATRGTISQTLLALERKGLVAAARQTDRRSLSYAVTATGAAALARQEALDSALAALPQDRRAALAETLRTLLASVLAARGGRGFGLCHSCAHHGARDGSGWCNLLQVPLASLETQQICAEHAA